MTKAVKRDRFLKLRREMGVVSFDSLNEGGVLVFDNSSSLIL
jgi:hypothetical protein